MEIATPGGTPPATNPPAGGGSSSGSGAGKNTVVYTGHESRRYGSFEIEVGDETWTFPRDRKVEGVPQDVVEALKGHEGHEFDINKGA